MRNKSRPETNPNFRDWPFSQLIERDEGLADLRRSYAARSAEERRKAADWAYHESSATDIVNRTLARGGEESPLAVQWPPGYEALAIDPTYAPALLTVGSIEFQLKRKSEALALFDALLALPKDTDELEEIIDQAGTFLLDGKHVDEARLLFEKACGVFPESTLLLGGWGYSLAKLGQHVQAVTIQKRAVALDPDNSELLNDLGWALAENRQFEEAEQVLQKAVDLASPEYDRPLNSLRELRRRKQSERRRRS